jgi:hypothetical protein
MNNQINTMRKKYLYIGWLFFLLQSACFVCFGQDKPAFEAPSISFMGSSTKLSKDAKAIITAIASQIKNNPQARVVVKGYCSTSKREQQLSWDRVYSVVTHLIEKEGIRSGRLIFMYGEDGGDCNTVDIEQAAANQEGPSMVPPPHPNLRRRGT